MPSGISIFHHNSPTDKTNQPTISLALFINVLIIIIIIIISLSEWHGQENRKRKKKSQNSTNQEPFLAQQRKLEPASRKNYVTSSTVQTILHTECIP